MKVDDKRERPQAGQDTRSRSISAGKPIGNLVVDSSSVEEADLPGSLMRLGDVYLL